MVLLVLGALLAGFLASLVLPFVPFAAALVLAAVIGAAWTALQSQAAGSAVLEAVALTGAAQVGYGLGLVGMAAMDWRSASARRGAGRGDVRDLRLEEKR